jgi:hypothetical protein
MMAFQAAAVAGHEHPEAVTDTLSVPHRGHVRLRCRAKALARIRSGVSTPCVMTRPCRLQSNR